MCKTNVSRFVRNINGGNACVIAALCVWRGRGSAVLSVRI